VFSLLILKHCIASTQIKKQDEHLRNSQGPFLVTHPKVSHCPVSCNKGCFASFINGATQCVFCFFEPRALHMLGKHFTSDLPPACGGSLYSQHFASESHPHCCIW
jgi:hypothetical protein